MTYKNINTVKYNKMLSIFFCQTTFMPLFFSCIFFLFNIDPNPTSTHPSCERIACIREPTNNMTPQANSPHTQMKSALTHSYLLLGFRPSLFLPLAATHFWPHWNEWSFEIKVALICQSLSERHQTSFHSSVPLTPHTYIHCEPHSSFLLHYGALTLSFFFSEMHLLLFLMVNKNYL